MNIKDYFKTLLKYNTDSKGLNQTARIVISEDVKPSSPKKGKSSSTLAETVTSDVKFKDVNSVNQKDFLIKKQMKEGPFKQSEVSDLNDLAEKSTFSVAEKTKKVQIEIDSTMLKVEKDMSDMQEEWMPCINKDELSLLRKSEEMMITVGLDFGTHQTKICIESKGGVELSYTFMKFGYNDNQMYYTLPSIIGIGENGKLYYGYLPMHFEGEIIRYFKQIVFRETSPYGGMTQELAYYYSVWYIAYILFDLEEIYGQNFSIQMGAPTDSSHIKSAKQISTRIIASSYKLVEDVFKNNKKKFLETDIETLKSLTEIVDYSVDIKEEYGLLVFPEAYACLKPLISQKKVETGMNLMIDIGGGTTDISFFTIENNSPQVYEFFSINKGLNFLTCVESRKSLRLDSNIKHASEIDAQRIVSYKKEIENICNNIKSKLIREFRLQTSLNKVRLLNALKNRPIVYCGGGSLFSILRTGYVDFLDIKQISEKEWDIKSITQFNEIKKRNLFSILSTAYGLAISTEHDNIVMKPFKDIFEKIRGYDEIPHKILNNHNSLGSVYGGFDYADDYDAWK